MSSTRTRSAIKMAKSEMWARSGWKDLECLAHGLGPLSHSLRNLRAVFSAAPDWFNFYFGFSKGET